MGALRWRALPTCHRRCESGKTFPAAGAVGFRLVFRVACWEEEGEEGGEGKERGGKEEERWGLGRALLLKNTRPTLPNFGVVEGELKKFSL